MPHWYTSSPNLLASRAPAPVPPTPDPVAWAQLKFHWQPDPTQAEILRTSAKRLMLCCTRQWGKSTLTAIKALHHALNPMLAVSGGALWLMSTPNGQSGFFFNEWHDVAQTSSSASQWQRTQVRADQCPRISPEFLAQQRISLGDQIYRQEYQCE